MLGASGRKRTEPNTKQPVRMSQEESNKSFGSGKVANFGERLRLAFDGAKNVQIARKLGLSEAAIRNYIEGRVPPAETLLLISERTYCSIDWLLTGKGDQFGGVKVGSSGPPMLSEAEEQAVRDIATETGEGYEPTLRRLVRDRLRAMGRLPAESQPLRMAYYGAEWADVPLLGQVAAGSPIETFEFQESVRVIKTWTDPKKAYALRVTGESMEDAGIQDGDLIVCLEASEARRGQLIVALIDGDKATVKRFYRDNGTIILQSANSKFEPQRYEASRVRIQGCVESIISASEDNS